MARLQGQIRKKAETESTEGGIMHKFQWISNRLLEMPNFKLVAA
jgi:hypothetical protein